MCNRKVAGRPIDNYVIIRIRDTASAPVATHIPKTICVRYPGYSSQQKPSFELFDSRLLPTAGTTTSPASLPEALRLFVNTGELHRLGAPYLLKTIHESQACVDRREIRTCLFYIDNARASLKLAGTLQACDKIPVAAASGRRSAPGSSCQGIFVLGLICIGKRRLVFRETA